MKHIKIYTTEFCPFCVNAKNLLKAKGLNYEEINIQKDPQDHTELVEKFQFRTVPMILIDDKLIGGFTELMQMDRLGKLEEFLKD